MLVDVCLHHHLCIYYVLEVFKLICLIRGYTATYTNTLCGPTPEH